MSRKTNSDDVVIEQLKETLGDEKLELALCTYDVFLTQNGQKLMQLLNQYYYDVPVIMPNETNFEFMAAIREGQRRVVMELREMFKLVEQVYKENA